jgi:hypothetical protein
MACLPGCVITTGAHRAVGDAHALLARIVGASVSGHALQQKTSAFDACGISTWTAPAPISRLAGCTCGSWCCPETACARATWRRDERRRGGGRGTRFPRRIVSPVWREWMTRRGGQSRRRRQPRHRRTRRPHHHRCVPCLWSCGGQSTRRAGRSAVAVHSGDSGWIQDADDTSPGHSGLCIPTQTRERRHHATHTRPREVSDEIPRVGRIRKACRDDEPGNGRLHRRMSELPCNVSADSRPLPGDGRRSRRCGTHPASPRLRRPLCVERRVHGQAVAVSGTHVRALRRGVPSMRGGVSPHG